MKIGRGVGSHLVNAGASLEHFDGTGYELLDTEVQLYGSVGIVDHMRSLY